MELLIAFLTKILVFLMMCIAINHFTDILANIDLLQPIRNAFSTLFPRFGKLATCMFCQSHWLMMIACAIFVFAIRPFDWLSPFLWFILWYGGHRLIQIFHEFCERYLTRVVIPKTIQGEYYAHLHNMEGSTIRLDIVNKTEQSDPDEKRPPCSKPKG